jgi:hypothetical protein
VTWPLEILVALFAGTLSSAAWDLVKLAVLRLMVLSERRERFAGDSARKIADLAAILAGRKRPGLREEWQAHLAGEAGHELPAWWKVAAALGFVAAAVRYRLMDAADILWIPTDAVLKSRPLSNLVVGMPTVTAAAILFRHAGTVGVVGSAESIAAVGGSLHALIRVGRWWRGVKPVDPKLRRRVDAKQLVSIGADRQCALCGSTAALGYDHIVPLAMGGASSAENLQILCALCNRRKAGG